jgi:cell division protease FtsH
MSRVELENKMAMLLGGRAAEMLLIGHASTGAADDLAKATDIARSMVMRYGMDDTVGQVALENQPSPFLGPLPEGLDLGHRQYSQETAREIDCAVRALIDAAFKRATVLLTERRGVLEEGSQRLLARETLAEEDILQLVRPAIGQARKGDS